MLSENSISIKSSLLNDSMLAQRRQKERHALFIGILSQLIWAFNGIQLKTYRENVNYPVKIVKRRERIGD